MRASWVRIALNEIIKDLLLRWNYKFELLLQILLFTFTFIGFSFLHGVGNFDNTRITPSILGYIVSIYFWQIAASMSEQLREEAQTGTLEQMHMSPAPAAFVQIGRSLSTFLVTTVFCIGLILPLILLFQIRIPFHMDATPIAVITLIGVYGFALMIGGATLLYKQIDILVFLFQFMLLFFNGTFVDITRFPDWLATISRTLPTTQGIILLRQVLLDGQSLDHSWTDGSLIGLAVNSTIYFVMGWMVFSLCERKAKQKGMLGQY